MEPAESLAQDIFKIKGKTEFNNLCMDVFRYQSTNCEVYKKYFKSLNLKSDQIKSPENIPFLPIEFFKTHKITSGNGDVKKVFESSGTTGSDTSKHLVCDINLYERSYLKSFEIFYGDIKDWCVLGLLPSYLERENSSLVYMVDDLIKKSGHPLSGFHLHDYGALIEKLKVLSQKKQKVWLIGVTYALLDLAKQVDFPLMNTVVLETGGMKGVRKEMVREEIHNMLEQKFSLENIHSEYGMTELLSQGYSAGKGIFKSPPWMKVVIRDVNDPFQLFDNKKSGGINVIDLANLYSCSFIATQDLGKAYEDGSFEVLGRFDNSDIRGCNLLIG